MATNTGNTDRPNGFRPVKYLNGAKWTGEMIRCFSPTDDLFVGDLVERQANGTAAPNTQGIYQNVGRAEAGDPVFGVVVGFEANPDSLGNLYHASSTTYSVYIADTADLVLEAQADDATMVSTDVGLNIEYIVAGGNTTTGVSNMELNGDTAATTSTLSLTIVGAVDREDNDASDATDHSRWLVRINDSARANLIAAI